MTLDTLKKRTYLANFHHTVAAVPFDGKEHALLHIAADEGATLKPISPQKL